MNRIRVIFACVLGLCILALGTSIKNRADAAAAEEAVLVALLDETPTPQVLVTELKHTIQKGETFGTILQKYNVPNTRGIVAAAKPTFDLTKIRAGKELSFKKFIQSDKSFALSYPLDEDRTLTVFLGANPSVKLHEASYTQHLSSKIISVNNTLWGAAMEAGLRPGDIVRLANIFQWDVDFARELRQGAQFTLVADELVREDGKNSKIGEIHAVRLENDGKVYTAIHYTKKNGEDGWFAPDGKASKRPFLRSPLEFSRVTSRFNPKRFHPILKKKRPHLGVDYGAPRGTPVRAIGAGVVRYSGKRGGYGNFVKIDHEGPYHTQYAHLHRIKVRNGQRVKQGQVIGTVGSTGLATGPHLHFEFLSSGRHVDPTKVNVPTVEPLPKSERSAFFQVRDQWLPLLEEAASPTLANLSSN